MQGNLDPVALLSAEVLEETRRLVKSSGLALCVQSGPRHHQGNAAGPRGDGCGLVRTAERPGSGRGKKVAVVPMNLGGPGQPGCGAALPEEPVPRPAIIAAPGRCAALANFISRRRAPVAREIYALGGARPCSQHRSPARRLQGRWRHWNGALFHSDAVLAPFSAETAERSNFDPDEIVLLPLYPQYSVSTTGSSVKHGRLRRGTRSSGADAPGLLLSDRTRFIEAVTELVRPALDKAAVRKARPVLRPRSSETPGSRR